MKKPEMTLTQIAKNILQKNRELLEDDADFEELIERGLEDDSMFNTLTEELKRALKKTIDNSDADDSELKEFLRQAFEYNNLSKSNQKSLDNDIDRWLNGGNDISRDYAIKLCFALNMDPDTANSFLFKGCQQQGLNVRDAKEAIVLFCLLANQETKGSYSFNNIEGLYSKFKEKGRKGTYNADDLNKSNNTTQVLLGKLENLSADSFNDEDKFLDFLVENDSKFNSISKTTYNRYFDLFVKLVGVILKSEIKMICEEKSDGEFWDVSYDWKPLLRDLYKYCGYDRESDEYKRLIKLVRIINSKSIENDYRKEYNDVNNDILRIVGNSFDDFWCKITDNCKKNTDKKQKLLDLFYTPAFWRYLLPGTFDSQNLHTAYDEKTQKNFSLIKKNKYLLKPEILMDLSAKKTISMNDVIRKQIILMKSFELIYSSAWDENSDSHEENYYADLIDEELAECGYYSLYPRHYFDWIILMVFNYLESNVCAFPDTYINDTVYMIHQVMEVDI